MKAHMVKACGPAGTAVGSVGNEKRGVRVGGGRAAVDAKLDRRPPTADPLAVALRFSFDAVPGRDSGSAMGADRGRLGVEAFAVGGRLFTLYFRAFRWAFTHPGADGRIYWVRDFGSGWEEFGYLGEVGVDASGPERFGRTVAELRAVLLDIRERGGLAFPSFSEVERSS